MILSTVLVLCIEAGYTAVEVPGTRDREGTRCEIKKNPPRDERGRETTRVPGTGDRVPTARSQEEESLWVRLFYETPGPDRDFHAETPALNYF